MTQYAYNMILLMTVITTAACSMQPNSETTSNRSVGTTLETERNRGDVAQTDPQPKVVDDEGMEKLHKATVKTVTLDVTAGQGNVHSRAARRFATADAFEKTFRRVFPAEGLRQPSSSSHFTANPNDYFTLKERADLGSFNVSSPLGTEVNVKDLTNISLSYTRSLRGFLADACNTLVTRELAALKTKPESNILITTEGIPTAPSLNKFASRLFAYEHPSGIFPQVKTYADIIKESLEAMTTAGFAPASIEYQESLRSNYILYCVAMGQDPDLYIY